MLSVAKLRVGQEAYQLSGVAQSLDDYYTGAGEESGRWVGVGADRLDLAGEVDPDDLRAVLAGIAPGSGGLSPNGETIRPHPRRVPGFDLTFKAPKSVSVLYAVSDDPRVQGAIIEAGETALREVIGWLEREAIQVRRGTGNEAFLTDLAARDPQAAEAARIRTLPARGVVAASFRHRTSRSGDPLLHWHTLVANLVEGPDGRWTAFVHPQMYRSVRAAGEVFQALLRAELTDRLGLEWRPGRHVPEVAGIPQALCDAFSKRSREIEDWLLATGTPNDPAGRQAAVLATRRRKPEVEHERFDAAWKAEANDLGWGPAAAEDLLTHANGHVPPGAPEVWQLLVHHSDGAITEEAVDPETWIATLARELTEHDATFRRPDIVQGVAARLGPGASMPNIDRIVARVIASEHLLPIGDDRWTSAELIEIEARLLTGASRTIATRPPIALGWVDSALDAMPHLGADQAAAVRALAASADGVTVMVGPAGTGKTFALDALRTILEAAGRDVRGAAPSARAAQELSTGARMNATTIHRLLGSWTRGHDLPGPASVLVVDEAAMTGTRDLEAVVTWTLCAGGRIILVGDHHQLPAVAAGGGFAALAQAPDITQVTLTVNRRQHHAWEREALDDLRHGRVGVAVHAYQAHGRVVLSNDREAMVHEAVTRWFAASDTGMRPILLAGTNDQVHTLNQAIRKTLTQRCFLGTPLGTFAGRDLAIGDRVVARINDYQAQSLAGERAPLLNGHAGTITATTTDGLVVRLDHNNTDVLVSSEYLRAGGIDHGYALTAHRSQGGTWDVAIAVGTDGLYQESGYLLLSRGRTSNWLLLTHTEAQALDVDLHRHDSPIPLPSEETPDVLDDLRSRLARSQAKTLALTSDPHVLTIADIASHLDLATLEDRAVRARHAEHIATRIIGTNPGADVRRLHRATHTAGHIAIGQQVRATDRNNIGTIVAINDTAGSATVGFLSTRERYAERQMTWDTLQIVTPNPPARTLPEAATAALHRLADPIRRRTARWQTILADHGVAPGDAYLYQRATQLAVGRAADQLAAERPLWLLHRLGDRPTTPAGAQVWDDTVQRIAAHRQRHHITDEIHPFGTPAQVDHDTLHAFLITVTESRHWLDTNGTTEPATITHRSRPELEQRKTELDAILTSAPRDHRRLIDQLRADGQLPLDNLTDALTQALNAQGDRRQWILEHWPHVVEYAQVTSALDAHDSQSEHPELDIGPIVEQELSL